MRFSKTFLLTTAILLSFAVAIGILSVDTTPSKQTTDIDSDDHSILFKPPSFLGNAQAATLQQDGSNYLAEIAGITAYTKFDALDLSKVRDNLEGISD